MKKWVSIIIAVTTMMVGIVRYQQRPHEAIGDLTVKFVAPMSDALSRITKKPFGVYVSPAQSPVSPERFTGYHTGVDFETTPAEQDIDVPIVAICTGPLQQRSIATGYGGVLVQSCTLYGKSITVVYGHVRLSSITAAVGQQLEAGTTIALLGRGSSSETGGERKHLHLGIHTGPVTNIRGYVAAQAALSSWIDIRQYLK